MDSVRPSFPPLYWRQRTTKGKEEENTSTCGDSCSDRSKRLHDHKDSDNFNNEMSNRYRFHGNDENLSTLFSGSFDIYCRRHLNELIREGEREEEEFFSDGL